MSEEMNTAIIIPAHLNSRRFPRKPFAKINGRFMIDMVIDLCWKVKGVKVYIATPDDEICTYINEKKDETIAIKTSFSNSTGNEAVAQAARLLPNSNVIVNVQGDEPILEPSVIESAIDKFKNMRSWYPILNCMADIEDIIELKSPNTIKVIASGSNRLISMSRNIIPYVNNLTYYKTKKQVCIYIFEKDTLNELFFQSPKGPLEQSEDICMFRALEYNIRVYMYNVKTKSHAVDTPEDIPIVERLINENINAKR